MPLNFAEKYIEAIPHKLWIEEYAPTELSDITGNQMIIENLKNIVQSNDMPHLMFHGPNGCGRSTCATIIAKKHLGPLYRYAHLSIYGSLNRGKNVVTEKNDKKKSNDKLMDGPNIVNFIKKNMKLPENKYKLITIYDFDCMTPEAQMALRRIIELYANKVRFIFICNDLNKVIEAIQSRALPLQLTNISSEEIKDKLREISQRAKISQNEDVLEAISIMANGNLKQAIGQLQTFSGADNRTLENFYKIFNVPPIETIQNLINYCLKKNSSCAFDLLTTLELNGYNVTDILDIMIKVLSHTKQLTDKQRVICIEETIHIIRIVESSPSMTHLYKLVYLFINKVNLDK